MATHSSVLAWRIPGMGEMGGLPSLGSHRVGHDGSDLAAAAAAPFTLLIPSLVANSWSKTLPAFQANIISAFCQQKRTEKKPCSLLPHGLT